MCVSCFLRNDYYGDGIRVYQTLTFDLWLSDHIVLQQKKYSHSLNQNVMDLNPESFLKILFVSESIFWLFLSDVLLLLEGVYLSISGE